MSDQFMRLVVVIGYNSKTRDFSGVVVENIAQLRREWDNIRSDEWMKWTVSYDPLQSMLDRLAFTPYDAEGHEVPPAKWTAEDINEWLRKKPWEKPK